MTTYINIFGGPGIGKSNAAMKLSRDMNISGKKVEYVTEFAKDLVWEDRDKTLSIQPYVTIKQYRNLIRLDGVVDYVVTDAPILMGNVYGKLYSNMPYSYYKFILDLHNRMDTININLIRRFPYKSYGRHQTEDEAKQIDNMIKDMLLEYDVNFVEMYPDEICFDRFDL